MKIWSKLKKGTETAARRQLGDGALKILQNVQTDARRNVMWRTHLPAMAFQAARKERQIDRCMHFLYDWLY